ncbi:unnamed protein product, partial [marine sediment metagenome]
MKPNTKQVLEKIDSMNPEEAIESLLSILKSSETWEHKVRVVDLLLQFQ